VDLQWSLEGLHASSVGAKQFNAKDAVRRLTQSHHVSVLQLIDIQVTKYSFIVTFVPFIFQKKIGKITISTKKW